MRKAIHVENATLGPNVATPSTMVMAPSMDGTVSKAAVRVPPAPEEIRRRAYEKWEKAGHPAGDGVAFWLEAERELSQTQ